MENYRWLIKTTCENIKSKDFRQLLFLLYHKNIKREVSMEHVRAWGELLREIAIQQKIPHKPREDKFRFENCLVNYKGFKF
jgi:hypothetical protein